jgi:hypothetical protein
MIRASKMVREMILLYFIKFIIFILTISFNSINFVNPVNDVVLSVQMNRDIILSVRPKLSWDINWSARYH